MRIKNEKLKRTIPYDTIKAKINPSGIVRANRK